MERALTLFVYVLIVVFLAVMIVYAVDRLNP